METKIDDLAHYVSKYDPESFAGFFAYFIRRRPNNLAEIELNKFESKLKDFLYLIALNAFSSDRGDEKFEFSEKIVGELADKVNEIKKHYRLNTFTEYSRESVIHEMAFRNHFDNGVLSYVEQDLERLRTVFAPFENKIIEDFGLDIDFLIEVYKQSELISSIRFEHIVKFSHSREYEEFINRINLGKMKFSDAFNLLPENIQDEFLAFSSKNYCFLMFTKEDLYLSLPKEKVDKFLDLFSCGLNGSNYRYYASLNPLELAPILKISDNSYLNVYQKQIPVSIYRRLYEHLLKDGKMNDKIRKHREKSLEKKVAEMFRTFFPSKEAFFYENYYIETNFEQDLLIIYKGAAIIVETKASKLREPFRDIEKAICRLKDDFKESIQFGYEQCRRIEDYFLDSEKFAIKDGKGNVLYQVNPNKIHSVYSIVVTLERFGSLQTDLGLMLEKEEEDDFPWSVYLDDLEIFLLALKHEANHAGKFLEFLRRRRQLQNRIYAIDELDVCASYMQNPTRFASLANNDDSFITFSPYEQEFFDKIYHSGGLKFKEKPLPDEFYRY